MIPKELFKKVRNIEITTSRLVTDIFAGEYHSTFKGQGIEFDEVREYQPGDDIRTIDWNVTARQGRPHVKKFVEERELTVMIAVDLSASSRFGSTQTLKNKMAAEIAAVLALSAIRNNDKVGLIIFTDTIELYIAPRKGRTHVLRLIREILYFKPKHNGTDIVQAIQYLNRVQRRKAIAFLVSDFIFFDNEGGYRVNREALKKALAVANKRHDMIAVALHDPKELAMDDHGLLLFEDAETGEELCVDTTDKYFTEEYRKHNATRLKDQKALFRSVGMDSMDVMTNSSFTDELTKFFMHRKRR